MLKLFYFPRLNRGFISTPKGTKQSSIAESRLPYCFVFLGALFFFFYSQRNADFFREEQTVFIDFIAVLQHDDLR